MEHPKPAVRNKHKKYNKMQNKYYNWKLWCGESDLDGRKFNDILFGLMFVKQ